MRKLIVILALALVPRMAHATDAMDFDNPERMNVAAALDAVKSSMPEALPADYANEAAPTFFNNQKIVGGTEANKGEFPFIVSLQAASYGHFCGGSLIKKNWVLTAAHCVEGGYLNSVVIGLHNLSNPAGSEKFAAAQIIKHPNWNKAKFDYDFALIRLDKESKFTPVALNPTELTGKVDFITTGWGTTSQSGSISDALLKVSVPLVSKASCEAAYPGKLTDSMLCAGYEAGGKDSCQGDSGGPLVVGTGSGAYLAGVVSWGEGCAQPKKYGIYSKVNSAFDWINSVTK
ncbi:MAG: serine protease [Elusimicrobiota bacterium]